MQELTDKETISRNVVIDAYKTVGPLLLHYKGGLYLITDRCLIHHPTLPSEPGYTYLHLWPKAQALHARQVVEFHSILEDGRSKWAHLNKETHPLPTPLEV